MLPQFSDSHLNSRGVDFSSGYLQGGSPTASQSKNFGNHLSRTPKTAIPEVDGASGAATLIELSEASDDNGNATVVSPLSLGALEEAGKTDIGRQRRHNEDCFFTQSKLERLDSPSSQGMHAQGVYILCDGMGGHAGGAIASALAIETLHQYFETNWLNAPAPEVRHQLPTEASIREAIHQANQAIYEVNQNNASTGSGRMGTTLVLALIQDMNVAIAHVGDSRLYRLARGQGLELLTRDHEVGQLEIQRGVAPEIAYSRPDAYQLTQALGPRDNNLVNPSVQFLELREESLLLLASDGLTDNNLLEDHWQTHLKPLLSSGSSLEQGVTALVDLANHYNGHDNITAVLVRVSVNSQSGSIPEDGPA